MSLKKRKHSLLDEFKFKTVRANMKQVALDGDYSWLFSTHFTKPINIWCNDDIQCFICSKLSPLVESNLSDTSASAYRHRVQGSVGSFSSTSPSSSEAFNLQSRSTVHISPLPPTESHCTKTAQVNPDVSICQVNVDEKKLKYQAHLSSLTKFIFTYIQQAVDSPQGGAITQVIFLCAPFSKGRNWESIQAWLEQNMHAYLHRLCVWGHYTMFTVLLNLVVA